MLPEVSNARKGGMFYGWFALAGVMLVIFTVGGIFNNSFGVLLPAIINEYGWSRAVTAGALSIGIMAFGLPSPLYGILVARFGPRFTLILGNLLAALGIAGVCLVREVWHLYLLYILVGLGGGFGGYISCTTVANNWFVKKRSLALGIFVAAAGLGGFVFPPLATALTTRTPGGRACQSPWPVATTAPSAPSVIATRSGPRRRISRAARIASWTDCTRHPNSAAASSALILIP